MFFAPQKTVMTLEKIKVVKPPSLSSVFVSVLVVIVLLWGGTSSGGTEEAPVKEAEQRLEQRLRGCPPPPRGVQHRVSPLVQPLVQAGKAQSMRLGPAQSSGVGLGLKVGVSGPGWVHPLGAE